MGIQHCSLDGAHENMPWPYLTPAEMYVLLLKKNGQINYLKLCSLNNAATIAVWNRHLDGWKWLAAALEWEDIPHICSLMAFQTCAGTSVFSIIEKVKGSNIGSLGYAQLTACIAVCYIFWLICLYSYLI